MSEVSQITRKVRNVNEKKRFKWTNAMNRQLAEYVRDNYSFYEKTSFTHFVKKMKEDLKIDSSDKGVGGALTRIIKSYKDAKLKENQSGFEVDLKEFATIKDYMVDCCPQFEILDAVMGTQPNVAPIYQMSSGIGEPSPSSPSHSDDSDSDNSFVEDFADDEQDVHVHNVPQVQQPRANSRKRRRHSSNGDIKLAIAQFTNVLKERSAAELQTSKLQLELKEMKFLLEQEASKERLILERYKVDKDFDMHQSKMAHELRIKELEIEHLKLKIQYAKIVHENSDV